jgi:hypothetical protein
MNYLPDRKVWAGGFSGIAAWFILMELAKYNITTPIDATTLSAGIAWIATYLIPPADRDIVKRVNDDIVEMARNDPANPTTKP